MNRLNSHTIKSKSPDIAILIRSLHGGGAERVMVHLAHSFIEHGLHVDLLLPRAEGEYLDQLSPQVNLIDLKSPKVWTCLPKLVRYLKQDQPKAMLAALHYTGELAILAKKLAGAKTRVVVSERNTLSVEAEYSKQLSVRLTPLAAKITYPLADGIMAVSKGVAADLAQVTKISVENIKVVYNPSITEEFQKKLVQTVEHPWFQDDQPPVILGVGRLHPQKDFDTLLRAFALVRQSLEVRLVILGEGPERNNLERLAQELKIREYVDFPGFVHNPYSHMAKANVFVSSSIYEGMGNVLIEALAAGATVVSTDCPHGAAEVLDYGKWGLLTPVGNIAAMAATISTALKSKPKLVPQDWLHQFTPEICTYGYLEALGFSLPEN